MIVNIIIINDYYNIKHKHKTKIQNHKISITVCLVGRVVFCSTIVSANYGGGGQSVWAHNADTGKGGGQDLGKHAGVMLEFPLL